MRTLLIDDEPLALARLAHLLKSHSADIQIVGQAANGLDGLALIAELQPEVVFLDIDMPQLSGFALLAELSKEQQVVFTTAYDCYAVRAFEEQCADYLLKPIEPVRLAKTVQRLRQKIVPVTERKPPVDSVAMGLPSSPRSLSVKSGRKILLIPLETISYFESQERYVFLYTTDGLQYMTSHAIAVLEERLPTQFMRVSRSCIINTTHICDLQRYVSGKFLITLMNQSRSCIETGNAYINNIKKLFEL